MAYIAWKYLLLVITIAVGLLLYSKVPLLEFSHRSWQPNNCNDNATQLPDFSKGRALNIEQPNNPTEDFIQLPDFSQAEVFGKIPKILHQTWKTADRLPMKYVQYRKTWLEMHPNWTHHLWTDEENRELVRIHYPWLLDVYDAFPVEIMRSDTSHYLQMHKYGGMYADLDMEPLRSLDFLIENATQPVTLSYMRDKYKDTANVQPGFIISEPGHPLWLATVLKLLASAQQKPRNTRPDYITGPIMFYHAILLYEQVYGSTKKQHSVQWGSPVVHDLRILDPGLIYPYHWSEPYTSTKGRLCGGQSPSQNETECKKLFPNAYTVQYSCYSWGKEWENFLIRSHMSPADE